MNTRDEYERLIAPIETQMLRTIWAITQDGHDAEEALQNALIVVWRKFGRIQRHPNPHALVLRICSNAARDLVRANLRRRKRETAAAETGLTAPPTPEQALAEGEQRAAIFRAIDKLSKNQSVAVMLRLVQGESYDAIAQVLGCKDSTARKHVERGRERLRKLLAPLREQESTA